MSQSSDYSLANQSGANFRAELNTILGDVKSTNSGAIAPSNPVEGTLWYDSTNNVLKAYNGASFVTVDTDTNVDTTYTAGSGVGLSGTSFSVAGGTGLTQTSTGLDLNTASSTEIGGLKVRFNSATSTLYIRDDGINA